MGNAKSLLPKQLIWACEIVTYFQWSWCLFHEKFTMSVSLETPCFSWIQKYLCACISALSMILWVIVYGNKGLLSQPKAAISKLSDLDFRGPGHRWYGCIWYFVLYRLCPVRYGGVHLWYAAGVQHWLSGWVDILVGFKCFARGDLLSGEPVEGGRGPCWHLGEMISSWWLVLACEDPVLGWPSRMTNVPLTPD